MKSEIIKLHEPVEDGSVTISEIEIHEPRGKTIRKYDIDSNIYRYKNDDLIKMAAECSKYTDRIFDKLCSRDIHKIMAVMTGFLFSGREGDQS